MNVRIAAMTVFTAPSAVICVREPFPAPKAVNAEAKMTWLSKHTLMRRAHAKY